MVINMARLEPEPRALRSVMDRETVMKTAAAHAEPRFGDLNGIIRMCSEEAFQKRNRLG